MALFSLFPSVSFLVPPQVTHFAESLAACIARVWLFTGVNLFMPFQVHSGVGSINMAFQKISSSKEHAAYMALVRPFPSVGFLVPSEADHIPESQATFLALFWSITSVHRFMPLQLAQMLESLVTE